jgi:hypothetical protein
MMNILEQAFKASRTWQIAETAEYNGGSEDEKPNFDEWYREQVEKLNILNVVFSEEQAQICKKKENWKLCESWINNSRCLKNCRLHSET